MVCKMERPLCIPLSTCDRNAQLGLYGTVAMCMDIAAQHAQQLGVGSDMTAEEKKFWLAVRTKVRFFRRPVLGEQVVLCTWPQSPGRARCIRQYAMDTDTERLMCAKTEWAMMNLSTGRLCDLSDVYPQDTVFCEDAGCAEAFSRISENFEAQQCIGTYTVRSCDIDLGHHMNNAAYVRALLSMFSCRQLDEMAIKEAEFVYRTPCFEGETLQVFLRCLSQGVEAAFVKTDGKAAMLARLLS